MYILQKSHTKTKQVCLLQIRARKHFQDPLTHTESASGGEVYGEGHCVFLLTN